MIFNNIHSFQETAFDLFIYLSYVLIIISAFGLSLYANKLLVNIDYYARIYICLFLIWRFNPFKKKYEFTELDRKIVFSAGLLILTTTVLSNFSNYFSNSIKSYILSLKHKFTIL
jgi:hypothetical protein